MSDHDEEAMKRPEDDSLTVVSSEQASDTVDDAEVRIKTEPTEDDSLTEKSPEDDTPTEKSLENDSLTSNAAECVTDNNSDQSILIENIEDNSLTDNCDVTNTTSCEILFTPKIMKVESLGNRNCLSSSQLKLRTKILNHLCKLFNLDATLSLEENREIMKKRKKQFIEWSNFRRRQRKTLLISQMPPYFTFLHVRTLIELLSDFDVSSEFYFIYMVKSSHECLMRFMITRDCIMVLAALQGIYINGNPIKLDSDFTRAKEIIKTNLYIKRRYSEMEIRFQQYKKHQKEMLASTNIDGNCGADIEKESTEEATEKTSEDDASQKEMVKDQSISSNEFCAESGMNESINENDDENVVVLIKNLPQKKKEVLLRLIKQKVGKHMNYLYRNLYEAGKLSDNYLLKFFKPEDAKNACEKINKIRVCGRLLEAKLQKGSTFMEKTFKNASKRHLSFADEHQFKKRKLEESMNVNLAVAYLPPEVGMVDTYGLKTEFLKKHGIRPPLYSKVYVQNLHPEVDEAKLLEVFSLAGEVKKIDLCMGIKGPKAFIDFDHPIEAVQAISLFNGHKLYEKEMQVHMNRIQEERLLPLGLSSIGQGLGQDGLPMRGVRTNMEIKKISEKLFDIGKINRVTNSNTTAPFEYHYVPEASICVNDKTNARDVSNSDSWNTNVSTNTWSANKYMQVSQSTNTNPFCDAIQALGSALITDGLVPPGTDCRNLHSIMSALKSKAAVSDTMTKPNANSNFTLQHDFSRPPPTPRGPNMVGPGGSNPHMATPRGPNPNMGGPRGPNPNMSSPTGPNPNTAGPCWPNPNVTRGSTFENQNMLPSQPQNNLNVPNFTPNQGNALSQVMNQLINVMSSNAMMPNMIQPNMLQAIMQADMAQNIMQSNMTNVGDFGMGNQNQMLGQNNFGLVPNMNQHAPVPTQAVIEQTAIKYDIQSGWSVPPQNPASVTLAPVAAAPPMAIKMPQNKSQSSETAGNESSQNDKETSSGAKKGDMLMFNYLPPSVTADALAIKMREVGELMFSEITGKGRAVVRFKSAADAQKCYRLFHNSKVDGHIIEVKIVS